MNFNRGATTGIMPPTLTNAKLNFGPSATGVATFIMQGEQSTSQLSGDIGVEQTVWIRGNSQPGNAIITALNGFTNAGVIRMESQFAGYQSNLTIANGALTNTGVINSNTGTGGSRIITGQVDNRASVNVNHDLSINGTFTTNGILGIGLDPTITKFDQLKVSGSAALDSTLNLDVVAGFNPPLNATYQIITCNTCSGMFTTVNGRDIGNGKRLVVIYNPTNVTVQVAPEEVIAGLTAANNSPTPLDSVTTLTATLTAGSNVSYAWDFGDGTIGNGRVVTHIYPAAGNYTATVTATNTLGSATATTAVNIFIVPITGLTASNNSPTPLDSATTLTANVTGGSNVSYAWNFGDGTTGNGRVVTHTYPAAGNYKAIVTAVNAVSSVNDTTEVNIFVVPIAGLAASNNSPTPLDSATTLTATVTAGSRVNYSWDFGDGTTGNGRVVTHTYPAVGVYAAVVTASNAVSTLTDTTNVTVTPTTTVEEFESELPTSFMLSQNYPNPFNPSTTIRYAISQAGFVTLKVYNLLGKEIETVVSERQPAGKYEIRWNPVGLPSGIYFYQLQAGQFESTKKLILLH
jgi:PKD repeat protein